MSRLALAGCPEPRAQNSECYLSTGMPLGDSGQPGSVFRTSSSPMPSSILRSLCTDSTTRASPK